MLSANAAEEISTLAETLLRHQLGHHRNDGQGVGNHRLGSGVVRVDGDGEQGTREEGMLWLWVLCFIPAVSISREWLLAGARAVSLP